MKRVVFIASHLGSGSLRLINLLNCHDRISIESTNTVYATPLDWIDLTRHSHKCRTIAAIYGDHLLYNIQLQCKWLYEHCEFIYVIRGGKEALCEINFPKSYGSEGALRYYCFRLRRIYEMAKHCQKGLLVTWQDLRSGKATTLIEEFLKLKTPLPQINPEEFVPKPIDDLPLSALNKAQDCFEYYLYKIKNI